MNRAEMLMIINEIINNFDTTDSLGLLDCISTIEEELNIRFEPEVIAKIETVDDVKEEALRLLSN